MKKSGNISARSPKSSSLNEWQLLLMAIPILIIAGFQVFWLRENYIKEKKNLEFRSSVVFKEAVRKLQAKKLNLDKVFKDPGAKIKVEVMNDELGGFPGHPEDEITNAINEVTVRANDSLRVKEIDSACRIAFDKEGMNIPFSILKDTSVNRREELRLPNKIMIGFAHPVIYELSVGNTFGYLIKKLISPILFSLFLVGV